MSNSSYIRTRLALIGLQLAPPLIRSTLLEESGFRKEYGFKTNAVLSLGDLPVFIQRSQLFTNVRKILTGLTEKKVKDTAGKKWRLCNINKKESYLSSHCLAANSA